MKKLGATNQKILKIFHLLFAIMWVGGVMSLVSLQLGVTPSTKEDMYQAALSHLIVDEYFLIPGGIGIIVTALIYGSFTGWEFFKQRWLTVKWILTVFLVIIGAGYMGVTIKENVVYAYEMLHDSCLSPTAYWTNVYSVAIAGIIQLVCFIYIIIISVIKPWKKKQ